MALLPAKRFLFIAAACLAALLLLRGLKNGAVLQAFPMKNGKISRPVRSRAGNNRPMAPVFRMSGPEGNAAGICAALLFFCLGAGLMTYETDRMEKEERYFAAVSDQRISVYGTVLEIAGRENGGARLLLSDVSEENAGTAVGETCEDASGSAVSSAMEDAPESAAPAVFEGVSGRISGRLYCYTDEMPAVMIGQKIRILGSVSAAKGASNRGGFDFRSYCRSKGVSGLFYAESLSVSDPAFRPVPEGLRRLGLALSEKFDRIAGAEDAGILKAVLLGDKESLEASTYELYRKNGISHLLAISGLHVSLIGMSLFRCLRKCGLGYWASGTASAILLFFYGVLTGFGPSIVRAVTMMGISFLGSAIGRTYDLASALCVPAVGLLLWRPFLLTQPGFQLSFLAVAAICYPGQTFIRRFGAAGVRQTLLVSLSIQLLTAPVILYHSFELPVYGILLNLIVIPLMSYAAGSGLLGLFFSFLWEPSGHFFLGTAHYILRFYEALCHAAERLPGTVWNPGQPALWQIGIYYLLLFGGIRILCTKEERYTASENGKKQLLTFGGLLLLAFLSLLPVPVTGFDATFLDVGQGDGILLESNRGCILVDCGSQRGDPGEDVLIPYLKSGGRRRLDAVIVSHGDQDHVSGIRYLLEEGEIAIGCLIMPAAGEGEEIYEKLRVLAEKREIPVSWLGAGDDLFASDVSLERLRDHMPRIRCLYPDADLICTDRNAESLVLEARLGSFSMLLTGDVDAAGEGMLLESGALSPVTVLKAAHHGSASSSGEDFIRAVSPSAAILSYGENNHYGHPSAEVAERLREVGADIHETAKEGAICIRTDGQKMTVKGWKR